jgi:putative phage-type endonuclease
MKMIPYLQGSEIWKKWRLSRICGTDSGIILDLNEFCDICTLWKQKLEMLPPVEMNAAMQYGKDNEDLVRSLFIDRTGIEVEPIVIESDDYFWMGCSLDGYNQENNIIVEIKCPQKINKHMPVYEGIISRNYYAQVQHQLACSKANECYFVSYHKDDPELIAINVIKPDIEFIKDMIEKEKEFYEKHLCGFLPPPEPWQFEERRK